MKCFLGALASIFLVSWSVTYANDATHWKTLTPGKLYVVNPAEGKPSIMLVAARGNTLSEPLTIGFYLQSSPACSAMYDPVNGPGTGDIGTVGVIEVDGKDYALDGFCDGGHMTMVPSVWMTRQLLLQSVKQDAVLHVTFKMSMPSLHLHYPVTGFDVVLKNLMTN